MFSRAWPIFPDREFPGIRTTVRKPSTLPLLRNGYGSRDQGKHKPIFEFDSRGEFVGDSREGMRALQQLVIERKPFMRLNLLLAVAGATPALALCEDGQLMPDWRASDERVATVRTRG